MRSDGGALALWISFRIELETGLRALGLIREGQPVSPRVSFDPLAADLPRCGAILEIAIPLRAPARMLETTSKRCHHADEEMSRKNPKPAAWARLAVPVVGMAKGEMLGKFIHDWFSFHSPQWSRIRFR